MSEVRTEVVMVWTTQCSLQFHYRYNCDKNDLLRSIKWWMIVSTMHQPTLVPLQTQLRQKRLFHYRHNCNRNDLNKVVYDCINYASTYACCRLLAATGASPYTNTHGITRGSIDDEDCCSLWGRQWLHEQAYSVVSLHN